MFFLTISEGLYAVWKGRLFLDVWSWMWLYIHYMSYKKTCFLNKLSTVYFVRKCIIISLPLGTNLKKRVPCDLAQFHLTGLFVFLLASFLSCWNVLVEKANYIYHYYKGHIFFIIMGASCGFPGWHNFANSEQHLNISGTYCDS